MGLGELCRALATEWRELRLDDLRSLRAAEAAVAVLLAVVIVLWAHTGEPWWAALSAFRVAQPGFANALLGGANRVAGSAVGALTGLLLAGLFAYQPLPYCLSLFAVSWLGLFGSLTLRFGSGWMFFGLTADMVLLTTLETPQITFAFAIGRIAEVAIGAAAALAVSALWPDSKAPSLPPGPLGASAWPAPARPGFDAWLDGRWPAVTYAVRGAIAVGLLPFLARALAPLGATQLAVTVVALMVVPPAAILQDDPHALMTRALHRLAGCVFGSVLGLAGLHFVGDNMVVWLATIAVGAWIGGRVQFGTTGIGYVGMQSTIAFLASMIQGPAPPEGVTPGIARLAGMSAGLALLVLVSMVWVALHRPHSAAG